MPNLILVLEDDENRRDLFEKGLFKDLSQEVDIFWSSTPNDVISYIIEFGRIDYLFLDHDLFGQVYVPSGKNTGYEVACWLSENEDKMPKNVIIHSLNFNGAKEMMSKLPDAHYCPNIWNNSWDNLVKHIKSKNQERNNRLWI